MNDALDIALHWYRFWRDRGNDILIGALLAEFLIEALWIERPNWSPWNRAARGPKRWMPRLRRFTLSRKQAIIVAAFIVFLGVSVERIFGNWADDKADEIRTNLQQRIIQISPRNWLLTTDVADRIVTKLKHFAGQRVAVYENQKYVDDKFEVSSLAMSLDGLFNKAGWLNPSGGPIIEGSGRNGAFTNIWVDPPGRGGVNQMLIEADLKASADVKAAAKALAEALFSEGLIAGYFPKEPPFAGVPLVENDVIAITVGRRPLP